MRVNLGLVPLIALAMSTMVGCHLGLPQTSSSVAKGPSAVAWAWGHNSSGQLGNNTMTDSSVPVRVSGLTGVTTVAGGASHSLALTSDGTVWAWGANGFGSLGNSNEPDTTVPVQVSGLTGVTAVAAGGTRSLAVKNDGTVWAWGSGVTPGSPVPVQVSGLTGVTAVAVDKLVTVNLAVKSDGTVWIWGFNTDVELGTGTMKDFRVPVQLGGLTGVAAVACGHGFNVWCEMTRS